MILTDLALFEQSAAAASRLLKAKAHDSRLLVLCQLVDGEMQAGQFATRLSKSALSQHLAVLCTEGLIATRRDGQAIFYRLANPAVKAVITTLAGIYCPPHLSLPNLRRPIMLKFLSPSEAASLVDAGHALLVDVREADEFASRHIPGSLSLPLSLPDNGPLACGMDSSLIFTCQTGRRTNTNSGRLLARVPGGSAFCPSSGHLAQIAA